MSDPIRIGPPPDEQPEEDFSDFIPTQSQVEAAIAMFLGDYPVWQIRRCFEDGGCTPVVVDGLTIRVLEQALATQKRTKASEYEIRNRILEVGLEPHDAERLLPGVMAAIHPVQKPSTHLEGRGFFAGVISVMSALLVVFCGFLPLAILQHVDEHSQKSKRKVRKSKYSRD